MKKLDPGQNHSGMTGGLDPGQNYSVMTSGMDTSLKHAGMTSKTLRDDKQTMPLFAAPLPQNADRVGCYH